MARKSRLRISSAAIGSPNPIVRQQLKAEGAIDAEDHAVTVLRRMDLGPAACRDLLTLRASLKLSRQFYI